jgi:hypothetical protein
MAKLSKKAPTFQYGIEITKPHSTAMYDHNDLVADEMKKNILTAWKQELKILAEAPNTLDIETEDWDEVMLKEHAPKLVKLQKGVMYSGYGTGFTIDDVNQEFLKELDTMANWQLHEQYSYLLNKELVPRTRFMMVGFEAMVDIHDYSVFLAIDLSPIAVGGKQLNTPNHSTPNYNK